MCTCSYVSLFSEKVYESLVLCINFLKVLCYMYELNFFVHVHTHFVRIPYSLFGGRESWNTGMYSGMTMPTEYVSGYN